MKLLLNWKSYRLVLCLLCMLFFQQCLLAQTKSFIVPYQDKKFTFNNKEGAALKWFELNRKKEQESWYEYKGCKLNESGTSVDVITQHFSLNRAGEGGADKPETVKDDPATEATNIEVETLEDKVKAAEEPMAAVVKESVGSPAKGAKAKAAEKPAAAEKKVVAPLKVANIKQVKTEPSRQPDETATARGRSDLEAGRIKDAAPENVRAYENERPVADALAKAGYDVEFTDGKITAAEQAAEGIRPTAKPDLRVEGKIWDIYSPGPNTTPVSAAAHAFDKLRDHPLGPQTRRVVVALDALTITPTQFQVIMEEQIRKYGNFGMQEIFAVQKGKVYRIYPI